MEGEKNFSPERQDQIDQRKAWENLQSAKDMAVVFESKLQEANMASEKSGSKRDTMSAIHHAMSTGAGSVESAGDYLASVVDYLQKYSNNDNKEIIKLSDDLKQLRGKLETDWKTKGQTPEGYNPQDALQEIRSLFEQLRRISL
jgi:hypothetical protein